MTSRYALHPKVAVRAVAGEVFLVSDDRAFHHAHLPTAVDIINALREKPRTAAELANLISDRYEVEPAQAARDVDTFLKMLVERMVAHPVDA